LIFLVSTNRLTAPYPVYPLGLATVATQLRAAGIPVEVGDRLVDLDEDLLERIRSSAPAIVGLSFRNLHVFDENFDGDTLAEMREFVARIRAVTKALIVVGGSAVHLSPLPIVRNTSADFGIVGDGRDLALLYRDLERGGDGGDLPGVLRTGGRDFVSPERRSFEADLTTALLPRRYVEYYDRFGGMLNLQSRIGCPYRCSYCSYPLVEGRKLRGKTLDRLLREVERLLEGGCRYFFLVDSVFNADLEGSAEFARGLIERKLEIRWMAYMSPLGFPSDYMELLAEAGLSHVEFGTDSLSGEILDLYRKPFGVDRVFRSSEQVTKAGIRLAHFFVLGGPGETEATLQETLERSSRLSGDAFFYMPGVTLYAGTPMADRMGWSGAREGPGDPGKPEIVLESGFTSEGVHRAVADTAVGDQRWITPERVALGEAVAARIRERGRIKGPLWEFLALDVEGDAS
jgi:Radical SAM superfamily/B12 binding domain